MARLRKLGKSGRYFLIFKNRDRTPVETSVPMGCSDSRAARKRANEIESLVDRAAFDPWSYDVLPWEATRGTLAGAVADFLTAKRATCRPPTVRAYSLTLRQLQDHTPTGLALQALRPSHLQRTVGAGDVADATRRQRYRNLRAFVKWAQSEGAGGEGWDPLKGVTLPKAEKRLPAFLTPPDLDRVLAAVEAHTAMTRAARQSREGDNVWLIPVVQVAAYTGLRLGELCAARWSWVDLDGRSLTVRHSGGFRTKGGRERTVPLAGPALDAVRQLAAEREARGEVLDGPLFPGPNGSGIQPNRTSRRFKFFSRLAKLPEGVHFHSLRHSCGSMLALAGVPAVVIAEVLGHASTATTAIYVHAAGHHVRDAMERAFAGGGA